MLQQQAEGGGIGRVEPWERRAGAVRGGRGLAVRAEAVDGVGKEVLCWKVAARQPRNERDGDCVSARTFFISEAPLYCFRGILPGAVGDRICPFVSVTIATLPVSPVRTETKAKFR